MRLPEPGRTYLGALWICATSTFPMCDAGAGDLLADVAHLSRSQIAMLARVIGSAQTP